MSKSVASVAMIVPMNTRNCSLPTLNVRTNSLGEARRKPVYTSIAPSAASGMRWMRLGNSSTKPRRKTPCQAFAHFVRAPLSIFALLRTISEIIGSPPTAAAMVLAKPTASKSRSKFVLRFHGSSSSIAFALNSDSRLPIKVNSNRYCKPVAVARPRKSGNANADAGSFSTSGMSTKKRGPTS